MNERDHVPQAPVEATTSDQPAREPVDAEPSSLRPGRRPGERPARLHLEFIGDDWR